jgi:hypothetical protein
VTIFKLFRSKFSDFLGKEIARIQEFKKKNLARFLFMVQVGSQKYIGVFKFLFSYFVNQLMDDLHLNHMTKVGGKKQTHTHTHTHKKGGQVFFFPNKNLAVLKKSKKKKKTNPPYLLVFITRKFVPKKK